MVRVEALRLKGLRYTAGIILSVSPLCKDLPDNGDRRRLHGR